MPVLTGALVDVSHSMKYSTGDGVNETGGSWARSIFKVVEDLIKNDVTESNHVFALGFGASREPQVFNLLNTLMKAKPSSTPAYSHEDIVEKVLIILESSGAPGVRDWAKMKRLLSNTNPSDAKMILHMLQTNEKFKETFVNEYLPIQCRETRYGLKTRFVLQLSKSKGFIRDIVISEIKNVVERGMKLANDMSPLFKLAKDVVVSVDNTAVMKIQEAHEILRGCVGESQLTEERVDELMEAVRPFIFGVKTPLMRALDRARALFALPQYKDHHKLLFVLSDGEPSDGDNPPLKALSDLGVTVVSCFITDRSISEPLHLYCSEHPGWEKPAKFMFSMSSTIKTEWIPRTIFVKRGWTIDIENNETKLFCQVNHPDIIGDVCDLARNIVCSQDALADILASVSLDVYINQTKERFGAQRQKGDTCYANATAAVLHLAMRRIVGRVGGYPDFFEIRKKLIKKYDKHGANILKVLRDVCPQYRLQFQRVDALGAMKAVAAKRPVIAMFWLTDEDPKNPANPYEWKSFSKFYAKNPCGILTKSEVDISKRPRGAEISGHAVVLTSYDSESLRFMNSWGSDWADGGFFRVQNAAVLGLKFVDVFWTLNDLKQEEKAAYARHGPVIANKLLSSLRGLQRAQFRCPLCRVESKLSDFTGHLREVRCLKCEGTFSTKDAGDDLVLNMYLTSLSR